MRVGDWVEVRSKEEILGTLDKDGRLQNMPFMPQMFELCGRKFRVARSAHKTCDTISKESTSRRVPVSVHLEGVRCDGRAYDGCGAACSIFWKEAWLKPVDEPATGPRARSASGCTVKDVLAATRTSGPLDVRGPTYVCQATELVRASEFLPWWDFRQYIDDYRTGNATLRQLASCCAFAVFWNVIRVAWSTRTGAGRVLRWAYDGVQAIRGGVPFPRRKGGIPAGTKTPSGRLDLQPGELVRVKSYDEILSTLDTNNKNRGLRFDAEAVPYCGGTYRVRSRVNRIIDEKTGKMIELKNDTVILEGVVCQARYSDHRMLCPRAIYTYWREVWLERVAEDPADRIAGAS
jgi:hypothetical protein